MTTAVAGSIQPRWFYVGMAGVYVLIAVAGFTPTYWAPVTSGTFPGPPVLHIHGLLFTSWTLLFLAQTVMVATGNTALHRTWGVVGVSLVTAMICTVILVTIHSMQLADAHGFREAGRSFAIIPLTGIAVFAAFFAFAVINFRRPEVHKRLMMAAMTPLMQAAMARVFLVMNPPPPNAAGPPPVAFAVAPGLVVDLLLVVGMFYDWRTRGRPHWAYTVGLIVNIAVQVLCVPASTSGAWQGIAGWVESLAG